VQAGRPRTTFTTLSFALSAHRNGTAGTLTNALNDSIANGSINEVEVPYTLVFINYDLISGDAKKMTDDFIDLIHEMDVLQLSGLLAGGVRESRNDNPTGDL
jgi:hypothetical protein